MSAGLHLVFVIFLVVVRFPSPPVRRFGTDYRVRAAIKYVWQDRPLLLALIAVTTVGIASDPSITLTPSMADELGGGARLVGMLSAIFGIGAAVGMAVLALMRGRMASGQVSSIGLSGLARGVGYWRSATVPALAMAGFALAGLGFGWAMTGLSTVVQERAPEELRGRIMALWLVGFVGSRPIAAALLGGTADLVSVQAAFAVAAALSFGGGTVVPTVESGRPAAAALTTGFLKRVVSSLLFRFVSAVTWVTLVTVDGVPLRTPDKRRKRRMDQANEHSFVLQLQRNRL